MTEFRVTKSMLRKLTCSVKNDLREIHCELGRLRERNHTPRTAVIWINWAYFSQISLEGIQSVKKGFYFGIPVWERVAFEAFVNGLFVLKKKNDNDFLLEPLQEKKRIYKLILNESFGIFSEDQKAMIKKGEEVVEEKIGEIDKKAKNYATLRSRCIAVGLEKLYVMVYSLLSHHVHGNVCFLDIEYTDEESKELKWRVVSADTAYNQLCLLRDILVIFKQSLREYEVEAFTVS